MGLTFINGDNFHFGQNVWLKILTIAPVALNKILNDAKGDIHVVSEVF